MRTAAFAQDAPALSQVAERSPQHARKESPLLRACKSGSSKACNELGDRLTLKHAYAEARQWYAMSCERVRSSMLPSATRLMQISHELAHGDGDAQANGGDPKRVAELKSEAAERRAGVQGCLDTGDTLKLDGELKQSLKYYDTVCEFSTLVDAVGDAVPGLERVTESGCTAGQAARAQLPNTAEFTPQLFVDVVQQQAKRAAAKQGAPQEDQGMVFNEGDL